MPLRSKPSWTLMFFGCLLLAGCDLFVSAEARVDRAEQHVAEGDYRAAMIELKNALQDQPDNVDARLLLSRVSLHMGDLEAAEKELERAVDAGASPEQVGTLRYELLVTQRRFADALTFLDADTTTGKADKLYYTAIAELGAGNVAAAREAASSLLASDPGSVRGHIQMAEVLAAERRLDDALAEVGKALELAPRDATALWTRGRLLLVAGRAEEAETSLVAATADPIALDATTRAAALAALSESHFAQQDLDAAAESIAALERVAPGAPGTRLLKARMALVQNRPSDAVAELDPVVQALPEYVPAQLLMATALISQGSTARAETLLKRVISRFPDNQQARVLLARIRPDEARDLLAPMSTGESNPEVDWVLGQALIRSGSGSEGVELLERSAAAEPDNVRLQTDLAAAYLETGRTGDAIALLERLPQGAAEGRRDSLLILAYASQGAEGKGRAEVEKLAGEHADDARILTLVGTYMQRTGDPAAARDYFNRAIKAGPDDPSPWLALAELEYRSGDRAAARAAWEQAQSVDAGNETAALWLARFALEEQTPVVATEILDRAVAANESAVRARLMLAQLNLRTDNDERAEELFKQVVDRSSDRGAALTAVGAAQLRAGRTDDAIETFRKAIAEQPDNAEAQYALGAAYVAKQDAAAGRRYLERALELRPGWVQPAMLLAMLDVNAGRVDEALARAREVRQANPTDVTAIALEADVLAAAGRTQEALKAYGEAQAARPTSQVAIRMAQLRGQVGAKPVEEPLVEHLAQRPEDLLVRRRLAELYQQQGQRDKAVAEYERLIGMSQQDAEAINNLAWLYYELKDPRAEATARQASELAPENGAITDTLAWILVEKGDLKQGIDLLRKAADQAPNVPDVRYHLAAALARDGRAAEARSILTELLESERPFPSRPQAETLLKELGP